MSDESITPEPQGAAEPAPAGDDIPAAAAPASPTAIGEQPAAASPSTTAREVVYVEAPTPPRARGNRVVGVLLAIVGAVIFAVLYAVVSAVLLFLQGDALFGPLWERLMSSDGFWVPVLIFVLAFILLVVIVNRGGWAAHVFGSLLLAFVVYFASIGLVLVVSNLVQGGHRTFPQVATYTPMIAAAVLAREVSIWVGLAIAARGRRVRARNAEARASYDQELSEKRAQYERPVTAPAD